MALAKPPSSFQLCHMTEAFNSAHAAYTDHKSEFSKMAKVDQIQPDAKKNYNCNQCGYSSTKLSYLKTHMWVHSGENRLFVHNATSLAIKLVGLESTCESNPEKSLIVTNSANIPPQGNIFSKSTCSLVQGKSPFIPPIAHCTSSFT